MKMNASDIPYLKGQKFTNDLCLGLKQIGSGTDAFDRLEFLRQTVAGKSVIHVGCVDHMPLIAEKRKHGLWLHEILLKSARTCVGIDINREGIDYMKEQGIADVYHADIIRDEIPAQIKSRKFDYLVLGEMIEHVDNPVDFLSAVRKKFADVVESIVTTTPNAFRFQNMVASLRQRENINSDHRYWFTPYTLLKIMSQAGYEDIDVDTVWYSPRRSFVTGTIRSMIGSAFPGTKDCLIARAKLNASL